MSSPSSPSRPRLDRTAVVSAAIALADAHGLEAVSMRRLAESLGVSPMALYNHVPNREALLDAMVDRLVEGIAAPPTSAAWKAALRARILSARAIMQQHPWAQGAIETRTTAGPAVLAHLDGLMAIMFDGGLSADLVHHAMHALSTRMWGFTRDVLPTPSTPEDPDARAAALSAYASRYPAIVRMASSASHAGANCDSDAEFAFALDILLDAVERLHHEGWTSASRGSSGGI